MAVSYHHGNLRADLIAKGLRVLNRDGIASFSLRKLSQELGVSHTAAYRHFPSKEELLRAIFLESSQMFRNALMQSVQTLKSGEEALIELGCTYVRFYLNHPEILGLFSLIPSEQSILVSVFESMASVGSTDPDSCREIGIHKDFPDIEEHADTSAFGLFRNLVRAIGDMQEYSALSEREILLGFWSKVHGMAVVLVSQKNFIPADQIDATIDRVLRSKF